MLLGILTACGGNSMSVVGAWVEPVPGMEGKVQGVKIRRGRKCFFYQYGYISL